MAQAEAESQGDGQTLHTLFDSGLALHAEITDSQEDTRSQAVQDRVKKAILMLEDATRLVSLLDIFSRNEHHSELPAEHLKYFLLPVLLGDLADRVAEKERGDVVEVVQVYYVDFLQRCKDYSLADIEKVPEVCWVNKEAEEEEGREGRAPAGNPDMSRMTAERNSKMERFRAGLQLEADLVELRAVLAQGREEEVVRRYHLACVQRAVLRCLDELCSLELEVGVLRHMAEVREGKVQAAREEAPPARKLQPVIITKDKMQREVYGLGYPSLPVLSVDQFYEKRVADGWWKPAPATGTALQVSLLAHCFQIGADSSFLPKIAHGQKRGHFF